MITYAAAGIGISVVFVVVMVTSASSRLGGKIAKLLGAEQSATSACARACSSAPRCGPARAS